MHCFKYSPFSKAISFVKVRCITYFSFKDKRYTILDTTYERQYMERLKK